MFNTLYNIFQIPVVILILLPIIGLFLNFFFQSTINVKKNSLFFSFLTLLYMELLWVSFDKSAIDFQFCTFLPWLNFLNFNLSLGIDGISLFFLLLITILIPLCLLVSWNNIKSNEKLYFNLFLFMEFLLLIAFCVRDLLLFYIFFESILIPMFIIIGVWGSRARKIKASYLFFLYTLFGSLLLLLAIIYIYIAVGTTNLDTLILHQFSLKEQQILWLAFFIAFGSKVPMIPVHLWLPEAHVEAPTAGSILLAGVLLKLGIYGFIRFTLPLFSMASIFYMPLMSTIAILGILYTSLTAIRQTDLKRIIAYTSIAHMNLVILGICSFNIQGLEGAILQSISHGFVSSALFFLIGVIYDRHHTRLITYYSGLVHTMPLFTLFFLIFTMANIAFPGVSSFVGEFLILVGLFKLNSVITFFGAISMVLGGAYSLWLYNRICYGNLKIQFLMAYEDINFREFTICLPLLFWVFLMGIFPEICIECIHSSTLKILLAY
jgi:proton-translocating NADH-quinone oxidoreductase chain M